MRQRVTDIISMEEIAKWTPDRPVIIEAGTDTGKSYFIKNVLYQYAKDRDQKILMLIHRRDCVNQFQMEIEAAKKTDVITIMTYQKIEANRTILDLSRFTYIVNDEYHYFLADAKFNVYTDISFNAVMSCKKAIHIYMSATAEDVEQYLRLIKECNPVKYEIPPDWSFIATLTFFNRNSTLEEIAQKVIAKNEKALFVVEDVSIAYILYKKYEDHAVFNCSKSNGRGFYRYVDEEKINQILRNEKFESNLLITTTCMDAGVNLIDNQLKSVVIANVKDIGSLIQCMGRKRRQSDDDKIHLYIKAFSNKQIGGSISNMKRDLAQAEFLRQHGSDAYLQKYDRTFDRTCIVYDEPIGDGSGASVKRVNDMMYYKRRCDMSVYEQMIALGKYGYCKYLARKFGFYNEETREYRYDVLNEDRSLASYLGSRVEDEMLQRKNRKELIEKIDVRSDGHRLKSRNVLNDALQERGMPFYIEEYRTSKIVDGKQKKYPAAWKVVHHVWYKDH